MNGFETAGFAGGTLNPMLNLFEVHCTTLVTKMSSLCERGTSHIKEVTAMNMPGFTVDTADTLFVTRECSPFATSLDQRAGGRRVIPQQDLVSSFPTRSLFHCTPCKPPGWEFCCPPPGFGLPLFCSEMPDAALATRRKFFIEAHLTKLSLRNLRSTRFTKY